MTVLKNWVLSKSEHPVMVQSIIQEIHKQFDLDAEILVNKYSGHPTYKFLVVVHPLSNPAILYTLIHRATLECSKKEDITINYTIDVVYNNKANTVTSLTTT